MVFLSKNPNAELPKDVYKRSCAMIAEAFEPDGYRYFRSVPYFSKKTEDLTFSVSFQANRHNRAGQSVEFWVHASVSSQSTKKWREFNTTLFPNSDFVAGGQIGNLNKPYSWMRWDVVDPSTRGKVVADAVDTIRRLAIPFFAAFENPGQMVTRLQNDPHVLWMMPSQVFDYLACHSGPEAVRNAVAQFLKQNPHLEESFELKIKNFRKEDLPAVFAVGNYVDDLVASLVAYASGVL
jgi:hypothetical protein